MGLSRLPDDLIEPITSYLDGHDVVQLSRLHNMQFHDKVRRNARNWRIECRPFSLFPFSVYEAPGLVSLDVHLAEHYLKYALNFGNRALSPLVVQNWLISLNFSFPNCLSVLEDSRLLRCVPNLQNLTCRDFNGALTSEHLNCLPLNLRKVHLESNPRQPPVRLSIDLFASVLPVLIESVYFSQLSLLGPSSNMPFTQPKWPQNLKCLSVYSLPIPFILDNGPPLIEELKGIAIWDGDSNILMSRIPKSMQHLEIISFPQRLGVHLQVILDSVMPPLMRYFGLPLRPLPSKEPIGPFLTPTLTHLENFYDLQESFPDVPFRTLLPNIRELTTSMVSDIKFDMVPLNVEIINSAGCIPCDLLPLLPQTLTSLECCIVQGWSFDIVPRTLTKLHICLQISHEPDLLSFPASQWSLLPPHLVFLSFDLSMLESSSCLADIPCLKLKELSFVATRPSLFKDQGLALKNYTEKVLKDKKLVQYLPTELEALEINLWNTDCEWACWTNDLAKYIPKLARLEISRRAISRNTQDPPAEEFLGGLPPLLKALTIQIDPTLPLPMDIFSKLPQQLRTLTFILRRTKQSSGEAETTLRDEHFAHLPRLLTSLRFEMPHAIINRGNEIYLKAKLTPKLIPTLPPFLTSFPFEDIDRHEAKWHEAWKLYNLPEKWLGSPPEHIP